MTKSKKDTSSVFSKTLIRLMNEKNLSVRSAAEIAQVSSSTLNSWRSGSSPSDFKAIQRLAKALDVSFEFLLTGNSNNDINIHEVFDEEAAIFDGFARISIRRLIPKKKETA